jgi:hypothetical protein
MPALVAGIHALPAGHQQSKAWMVGTSQNKSGHDDVLPRLQHRIDERRLAGLHPFDGAA